MALPSLVNVARFHDHHKFCHFGLINFAFILRHLDMKAKKKEAVAPTIHLKRYAKQCRSICSYGVTQLAKVSKEMAIASKG